MWRPVATFLIAVTLSASCGGTRPASRLSRIRQRGALVCGLFPGIAGFAQVGARDTISGTLRREGMQRDAGPEAIASSPIGCRRR